MQIYDYDGAFCKYLVKMHGIVYVYTVEHVCLN